jgi:hypothetical protein
VLQIWDKCRGKEWPPSPESLARFVYLVKKMREEK